MKKTILGLTVVFYFMVILTGETIAADNNQSVQVLSHLGKIEGIITFCGQPPPRGTAVYIPGKSFFVKTGTSGAYELFYVPVATYNLAVEIAGQPLKVINNIVVNKRETTYLNINICPDNDNDGFDASLDCNDNNPYIFPGAEELCDGVDNNCDGTVDEGCQICTDYDNDGFYAQAGCSTPVDCDDTDNTVNPNADELCGDNIDNNCNGQIDENCPIDNDRDGYPQQEDCNDDDPAINPGASELCDGIDNDCDGEIDEGCVAGAKLVINEIDYDNDVNDNMEFIEIYNCGPDTANLSEFSLILVNGNDLLNPYTIIGLDEAGDNLPPDEFLVIKSPELTISSGALTINFSSPENNIQNGPDAIQLVKDYEGSNESPIDTVSYEGDCSPYIEGDYVTPGDFGPGSIGRYLGQDTDDNQSDFQNFSSPSPGSPNGLPD